MRTFTQKLACLLMVLLCCVNVQLKADELTVADGTSTSSYVPAYGLYADTQGAGAQSLYPESMLGDLVGGSISKLTFYLSSPAEAAWTATFEVSLGTTSESSLSSAFIASSDLTAVYTGLLDATGSTLEIELADPFVYSGGNLVVDITVATTGGNWKSAYFYGAAQTAAGRYRNSASGGTAVDVLPKATFEYTAGGGPTCGKPDVLAANGITATEATLNWSGGDGNYTVEWKRAADTDWVALFTGTTQTSISLQDLIPSTKYMVRVKSVCEKAESGYKSTDFTTECVQDWSISDYGNWTEDFEAYDGAAASATTGGELNACWLTSGTTYPPHVASSGNYGWYPHSGTKALTCYGGHCFVALPHFADVLSTLRINFWARKESSSYGTLKIGYITAVDTGGFETFVPFDVIENNGSLREYEYWLDTLPAEADRLVFEWYYSGQYSCGIDDITVSRLPMCWKPKDLHEDMGHATSSSIKIDWTPASPASSSESLWKVQYKKSSDSEWRDTIAGEHPFEILNLEKYTSYDVRVAGYCTPDGLDPEWSDFCDAITAKTAAGVPFEQSFNVSSLPSEWKRYKGLWTEVQLSVPLEPVSTGWSTVYKTSTNANGVYPDSTYHLYLNITGEECKDWIVSPTIEMEAGYQLSFYLALTQKGSSTPAAATATGVGDDQFILAISEDGGATWNAARIWNNDGSFAAINATANGQLVRYGLDAYAGKSILIAFYGESVDGGGDNNLHISGLKIDLVPACENSSTLDVTDVQGTTASLEWDNVTDATWQYYFCLTPEAAFTPSDEQFAEHETNGRTAELTGLQEVTNYTFYLRRKCGDDNFSEIKDINFKTIQTPYELSSESSYSNDFQSQNGWLFVNGTMTNAWAYGSAANDNGTNAIYISNDEGNSYAYSNSSSVVYASKVFNVTEAGTYTFSYDWKASGSTYTYSVYDYLRVALVPVSVDPQASSSLPSGLSNTTLPTGWVALDGGSGLYGQEAWTHVSEEYAIEETGYYKMVIVWRNYAGFSDYTGTYPGAIDNIEISRLACPKPSGLNVAEVTDTTATLEWVDESGVTWAYAYALANAEEPALTEYEDINSTSVKLEELPYNTAYTFYLRKHCGETYSAYISVPFKTVNPYEKTINNGTTTNGNVPIYGYYVDHLTHSQFIIPADSLVAIQWDTITDITFHSSSANITWSGAKFEVYMAEVEGTTISEFVDWNSESLTKVMNAGSLSIVDNKMVVTLDEPFAYNDGNLLIGFNQTEVGSYVSASWYGVTATGASISNYDENTIGQRDFLPKMTVAFKPGVAPTCLKPTELDTISDGVTTNSIAIDWTPTTAEANWFVQYKKASAEEWIYVADDVTAHPFTISGLEPATIYNIRVAAWCDPADSLEASNFTDAITITTECAAIEYLSEDFEDTNTLLCWSRITETYTYSGTNYYFPMISNGDGKAASGSNYLYFLSTLSGTPTDQYMILPEINTLEGKRIKFNARKEDASDENTYAVVGIMTDPTDKATFQYLDSIPMTSAAYASFIVSLNEYTGEGKYIAIAMPAAAQAEYATLLVDDIVIEDIPSCDEPHDVAAVLTAGDGSVATINWTAGEATSWVVEYSTSSDYAEAVSTPVTEASLALADLTPEQTYYARVKTVCGEELESVWSEISFTPTNAMLLTINDSTKTNAYVPIYGYYVDNLTESQFVIPADSIKDMQWGTIKQLTFYSSNGDLSWGDAQFEVYFASSSAATISAMKSWDAMDKAMNAASLAISGGKMVVTLDAPYQYTGGNLLIGFKQTVTGSYKSCAWYGIEATGASMGGYGSSINQQNFLPKMTIEYLQGEAPSCFKPTELAAALTPGDGSIATLSWTAGAEEEAWTVAYSVNEDFSDAIEVPASATTLELEGLTPETKYYAHVKAVCGAGNESEWSNTVSFTPTNAASMTINRGTITNEYIPIYGYYCDMGTHSQFVIPADSLADIQWAIIKQLTFYASNASVSWGAAEFEAYMTESSDPTISAMQDWESMEKVMEAAKLAISGNKMVVTLDAPYQYQGGNLVIGFHQTTTGSDVRSYWYGVTAANAAYCAYGSSSSAAQNFSPKMTIEYLPGVAPACLKPTGLAVHEVTDVTATLKWDDDENGAWKYAFALASAEEPAAENFLPTEDTIVTVAVAQNSDYIFYLRKDCGEDGLSQSISKAFRTKQTPEALPYEDGFEGENAWVFINGDRINAWVAGEATHNGEESAKAIYVSKDAGATNTYSTSEYAVVYAAKSFIVPAGTYQVQYDWKAQGYNYSSYSYTSPYDYLRVALVPDSIELTASTSVPSGFSPTALPTGWIALDGGQYLNQKSDWQTFTSAETAIAAGTYKVVFIWKNTSSAYGTYNPPAAIDNFSFAPVACPKQTEVAVPDSTITANTAVVHWKTGNAEQDAWQIAYDTLRSNQPDTLPTLTNITANPYLLEELLPEHTYYVYVRANCGGEYSKWSDMKSFKTASLCQKPDGLAKAGASVSSLTISWNTYGQTGFNLRYGTDGTNWTTVNDIATSPYTIEGLNASTSYKVQVQAACAAEQENSWSAIYTAKTAYGVPFEEPFSASSIPADWTQYTGLLSSIQDGTAELQSATYGWSSGSNNGVFDSHARANIYGTSSMKWLATPEIVLSGNVQLTFDLALTKYSGTLQEITKTLGMDDKFVVLVSTDKGATWTILREWNNTGSEYVYNDIACTAEGEPVAINLSSYAGQQVMIAFYGESTVEESGSDNNIHVDNVLIDLIPSCLKPTAVNVAEVKAHTAEISWTAGEEGQEAWQIAYDTLPSNQPDTLPNIVDVTVNPYVLGGLLPEHTYYIYVRANCGLEDGVSKWADVKSFTTTVACPAPTNFNAYLTPGEGTVAGLKWSAEAESYTVQYGTDNTFADYEELNVTVDSIALENLTAEATYFARVKANCGTDGESEWSDVISFVPTNKFELLVNDGEKTNGYVPVYGLYVDEGSHSQFIIPAADLAAIQWDTLKALTFYGEFTNTSRMTWGDAEFEVYVAEVEQTTLSALEDLSNLTKVRNAGSLSIEEGKMVVTLDAAYQYEGGNLLIGFEQTVEGDYAGVNWYGVSAASGASMGGYGSSVNKQSFLPKMLIEYVPGQEPACKAPKNLALDEVTAHTATFSWDAVEGADWRYAVAPKGGEFGPIQLTDENTVTVEGLNELTEYVFSLCRDCGEAGNSNVIMIEFMTDAHVASVPFSDDFEGANFWQLVNGSMENAWVIGEAASNGGSHSLYVSNDEGANNAYNGDAQAAVFATLLINLDEDTTYVFQYDWRCEGEFYEEDGALDYMRVAIVPAIVEIAAGATAPEGLTGETLPTGWVALDGGEALVNQAEWQHQNLEVELGQGQYKIVIAWINDEADGSNPAGAIDNFSIAYKQGEPTGLNEGLIGGDKAIKFIQNNHVYILVNGRIYDATGRQVK